MTYADYAFYTDVWHGDMPDADFAKWASRAGIEIDRLTRGRAAGAPAEMTKRLRLCCCELADALRMADAADAATQGGAVAGETVDGYSVSYHASTEKDGASLQSRGAAAICRRWLCAPVNLMYTGMSG